MRILFLCLVSLSLQSCSNGVPAVASMTIKNLTNFPVITKYEMSEIDGNKSGSSKTKANKNENHDWTYERKSWEEVSGDQKESIEFYLSGNFFTYTLNQPVEMLETLQWRTSDMFLRGINIDLTSLKELPDLNEKIEALHEQDNRIILRQNSNSQKTRIFIAASESIENMELLVVDPKSRKSKFVKMIPSKEVFIGVFEGKNVIQKTFTCKVSGCAENK